MDVTKNHKYTSAEMLFFNVWKVANFHIRQLASSLPSLQSGSPSHLHFLWMHSPERHCISLGEHLAGGVGWRPQWDGDSSDWSFRRNRRIRSKVFMLYLDLVSVLFWLKRGERLNWYLKKHRCFVIWLNCMFYHNFSIRCGFVPGKDCMDFQDQLKTDMNVRNDQDTGIEITWLTIQIWVGSARSFSCSHYFTVTPINCNNVCISWSLTLQD